MAKKYRENLSRIRGVGYYPLPIANSLAKMLTDAEKEEEKQKLMDDLNNDLKKYGLEKYIIKEV